MAEHPLSRKSLAMLERASRTLLVRASVAILVTMASAAPAAARTLAPMRRISAPPSYLGSRNNGPDCTTQYRTLGYEPATGAGKRHPLFLYFIGTSLSSEKRRHESEAPRRVTQAMARRGFVALSVEYDNGYVALFSDHANQLACLFGADNPESLLAVACALRDVDCDLGIATWGHSQGAFVAHMAANADERVRAVWATGYGGERAFSAMLPKNRLRIVNGEADGSNGKVSVLNTAAGFTAAECPDDGRKRCLRSDGSGWILITRADSEVNGAHHCWFYSKSCGSGSQSLEPSWVDPSSTKPYALEANADWVARTTLRRLHPMEVNPFRDPPRSPRPPHQRHDLLPPPAPRFDPSGSQPPL